MTDINATVPDEPLFHGETSSQSITRRVGSGDYGSAASNATVPGLGIMHPAAPRPPNTQRNLTEPFPPPNVPAPPAGLLPGISFDGASTQVGMPPPSDPFVADAITAPALGAPPSRRDANATAPPPDPDELLRGIETDSRVQTPMAHVAESRGRDGAMHVAIAQPAHGQLDRPAEPLVVVNVGTDPTGPNVTSISAPSPMYSGPSSAPSPLPVPSKTSAIVLVCIFGSCFIVAVGIAGALLARYLPGQSGQSPKDPAAASGASATGASATAPGKSAAPSPVVSTAPAPPAMSATAHEATDAPAAAPLAPLAPAAPAVGTENVDTSETRAPSSHSNGARPTSKPSHSSHGDRGETPPHASDLEHGVD